MMHADEPSLGEAIESALVLLGLDGWAPGAATAASASSPFGQPQSAHSFTCLAWLIKGLSMAGHRAGPTLAELPLSYLSSTHSRGTDSSLQGQQLTVVGGGVSAARDGIAGVTDTDGQLQQDPSAEGDCFHEAAATFEVVPAGPDCMLSLSREASHVKVKPLWQQRFYTVNLQQLEKLLKQSPQSADGVDGQQPAKGHVERQQGPLLLALAYLLKGTPSKISKADLPRLIGLMLTSLDMPQLPGRCKDKSVMLSLLQSIQLVMKDPTGERDQPCACICS